MALPIEVKVWPKEVGADYLIARTGRTLERRAAEALSEALGGLPLAHEQAAAYCEQLDVSLAEYNRRFDSAPAKFLDDTRHAPDDYYDGRTVAKTFSLAIEEADKLHPAAEPLIKYAALLAPEPIPLFVFSEGRESLDGIFTPALDREGIDEAVAALRAFALVDRLTIVDERDPTIATDAISLHRLIRQVAISRLDGAARKAALRGLLELVARVYPTDVFNNPKTWPRARRLDGIVVSLVEDGNIDVAEEAQALRANLMDELGGYKASALGDYLSAKELRARALSIREHLFGADHALTTSSLNNLALVVQAQGDLGGARQLFERALIAREGNLGPKHRDVAVILNNLGRVLHDMGQLELARPLLERGLEIREKECGPEDRLTAVSLNNLAYLLHDQGLLGHDQGLLTEARQLFERALAVRKQVLGFADPRTATSCNNLANLLRDQGMLVEARTLLHCALAIDKRAVGLNHPNTATDLSNLARVYTISGRYNKAEALFRRAVAIAARTIGSNHPRFHRYCSQYATLLLSTGRLREGLALAENALAAHLTALGPHHRWTRDSASMTIDALESVGRAAEATALRNRFCVY
jgi:tetratricopeptide (TPR) repeat protein